MDPVNARPGMLKQANLSRIRNVIKKRGTATRAEIVMETQISPTTVRALLVEMMQNGEIKSVGYDESSGGRKAERYSFWQERLYGAVFCISDQTVHSLLVDACGQVIQSECLEITEDHYEQKIIEVLDVLVTKKQIKAIGLGVPGIVEGGSYWRQVKDNLAFYNKSDIGDRLAKRYGIPVVMENDLNATAIGFMRCYEEEFPMENPQDTNMAYIHFEEGCVSAGFIAGGRIVRGAHNFAGELGLVPMENDEILDQCMSESLDDVAYTNLMIRVILWICGILNPQYITLGGPALRTHCLGPISDGLFSMLPKHMCAEILYSPDAWNDYHNGMAYLTAGKMFEDIQLVKD